MSELKTPVTALQEYCQRKGAPPPHYTISDFKNKSDLFTCVVRAFDQEDDGMGWTKQIAKHSAAANILKKLDKLHNDLRDINLLHQSITENYMLQLTNFCMEHKHPYPSIEITDIRGLPNEFTFTALCRVGSIADEAIGSTKSVAKQLAAQKVFNVIKNLTRSNDVIKPIIDIDKNIEDKKNLIKEYRRITNRSSTDMALQNRHNYFKDMPPDIKEAAWKILNDSNIQSSKTKADLLLNVIGIKYKLSYIRSKRGAPMSFVELFCDLDVVFANTYDKVFCDIIDYFRDMLD